MEKTDEHIMTEYQSGNEEAIRVIFVRYKLRILNFCFHLLGNRADAEEVSADVFTTLFLKKDTYNQDMAKFSTWLYTIARNKCISALRKRKYHVSLDGSLSGSSDSGKWEIPSSESLPRENLESKETSEVVRAAINTLPYEQREAIVLKQYHGMKYQQISLVLECSLEKVKILIFRAKEHLRVELQSFIQEDTQ